MALIRLIEATLCTADTKDAGTDARIFLGIGGREFRLDTDGDNFSRGSRNTFSLGGLQGTSNLTNAEKNRPDLPVPLFSENLFQDEVYVRLEGSDHWRVRRVDVDGFGQDNAFLFRYSTFPDILGDQEDGLWLGPKAGRELNLDPIDRRVPIPADLREHLARKNSLTIR